MPPTMTSLAADALFTRNIPESSYPLITKIFIAFQLVGPVGGIIMLLTVALSKVRRDLPWYNFIVSWIISGFSYSLLFIAGQLDQEKPAFEVCFAQAILIHAAPPLTAATSLGLLVNIWFTVKSFIYGPVHTEKRWMIFVMTLPYILHTIVIITATLILASDPDSLRKLPAGMYCSVRNPIPGRISAGLVASTAIPIIVFEVLIARALRRNWSSFRDNPNAKAMILRVFVFSLFGLFSLMLSLIFFFIRQDPSTISIIFNIALSTLPVTVVLVFGSQSDIIEAWMFWRKRQPTVPSTPSTATGSHIRLKTTHTGTTSWASSESNSSLLTTR